MAGKLGSQLQTSLATRPTRTSRKIETRNVQLENERRRIEFEKLKAQAQQLQQTKFSNLSSLDQYEQEYNKLSPDLQQFFTPPETVRIQQQQKIVEEKSKFDARIITYQNQLASERESLRKYEDWWNRQSSENQDRRRESYKKDVREYEYDIDELEDTIRFAQGEQGKIEQGYTVGNIFDYAENKAEYNRQRKENRATQKKEIKLKISEGYTPIKNQQGLTVGFFSPDQTIPQWLTEKGLTEKNVSYYNSLIGWSSKVGFEKISPSAQAILNPSAMSWQKGNPAEKLIFDKFGNVVGVESAKLGQSISLPNYNANISALSNLDTTLKLGGSQDKKLQSSSIVGGFVPFTASEQAFNRLIQPNYQNKILGSIKKTLGINAPKIAPTPPLEWETNVTAPQGMGGKGTAIITQSFTPETNLYVSGTMDFNRNMNRISEEIFEDYEKSLLGTSGLSQAKVDVLKLEAQTKFNKQLEFYGEEFSTKYDSGLKEIKRDKKWLAEEIPILGLDVTSLRKTYQGWEDKDVTSFGSVRTYLGSKMRKPSTPNEKLQRFTSYEKIVGTTVAREIIGGQDFIEGASLNFGKTVLENPRTIAFKTGLWTGATIGVYTLSSYTGGLGGVATSPVLKWAGRGLIGLYGGSVALRTIAPDTAYERGQVLGGIGASEILPMVAGGFAGSYLGMKTVGVIDYAQYKWIKKYPYRSSYKLTEMDILKGETTFPTISPSNTKAQLRAFKKLDSSFLLPEERILIKKGGKLNVIGTHATSNRYGFKEIETLIKAEGREINAMSVSNKRLSTNFLDIGKSPKYSLYSSQFLPSGSSPLGLRVELQGIRAIPKKYKPQLTLKELQKILGNEINPKYFKETAYLYEKGQFGTGYVAGLKSEIEGYLKGQGILRRTNQPKYYTQIADAKFYKNLEGINRKGFKEYVFRVEKFKITKPSTWLDKIMPRFKDGDLVFGRKAGQLKPTKRGRVIPYERFESIAEGDKELVKQIKKLLSEKTRPEVVEILKQKRVKEITEAVSISSKGMSPVISASYPSSYGVQLYLSSGASKSKSPSASYGKSYSSSSLKSMISSMVSYPKSSSVSKSLSSGVSYSMPSYSYLTSGSYSGGTSYTPPKEPSYNISYLKRGIKGKVKGKLKKQKDIENLGLFPDFTARVIGLEPKQLNVKQALKEIQKIQTGFGVRTGARIKGYSPVDEKSLLTGIMK